MTLFCTVLSITVFLQSCGSDVPGTNTVDVKDVYIPGIAADFIEVVDGSYEFKYTPDGKKERILLTVKLKLKKEIGLKDPGMRHLELRPLISDGTRIGKALKPDGDKVSDFLRSDVGSEVTLNFTVNNSLFGLEEGDAAKIMNDAVNFEFDGTDISGYYLDGGSTSMWDGETLYLEEGGSSSSNNSTSNSGDNSNDEIESSTSNNCDQFIKDYEEFVNSYIAIIKKMKANPSDMSIMTEHTEMASNAATMQSDAADCTDAKYVAKLSKLATKMANAAAGM